MSKKHKKLILHTQKLLMGNKIYDEISKINIWKNNTAIKF